MTKLKKVLLVDDDKALNFIHRLTFEDNNINCPIAEVNDGQQALEYLNSHDDCPDVILLDINMPGMDGFEFLDEMERRGKCCDNSKIYMLTSSVRDEDKTKALSSGLVKGFFDKPLSASHIEEILAKAG